MMKRIYNLLCLGILACNILLAQIPEKIDFQAIARNASGQVIADQVINVQLAILQGPLPGTMIYEEVHQAMTDDYGQFVLPVGTGTGLSGTFAEIEWSAGPHFMDIKMDPEGGTNYVSLGTLEMMTVPYAFYAEKAGNVDDADADPLNEIQQLGISGETLSLSGSNSIQLPDASTTNELQNLNFGQDNVLSISGGNSIQLPSFSSRWKESGQAVYLASGRVGIGLNTVPHTLTIYGQNQAYMNFLTSATEIGQSNGLVIGLSKLSHAALFWNYEPGEVRFGTDDKLRLYINRFGRVGIGTGGPSEKLEVYSAASDVGVRINAGSRKIARLFLSESIGEDRKGYSWEYDGAQRGLFLKGHFNGDDDGDEMFSLRDNGWIGVGTTEPRSELNIHSNRNESTLLTVTNEDFPQSVLRLGLDRSNPIIEFRDKPLIIRSEYITSIGIDPQNGYVGIGKDDPRVELDVKGDAEISETLTVKEESITQDMHVKDDALVEGSLNVGLGSTFNQILEFTGTTGTGIGNHYKDFAYPEGYTQSNTRVLCLQIKLDTGNWWGIGGGYTGYSGVTAVSRDNSVRKINACLYENVIRIWYPAREAYQGRPFRILLMRMGN
jgi:hypothetical protein